ncbi:hypothetical protein Ahy_A03g011089 [Arachis hypogaea]|uniref:GRF-type domain-containing protein n=1 Tax=Arachis hypogaea TaxID=3818 RepID=A0A445DPJ6_ARAHY|nr:hypothetical protein Ahy_A03g011089 [Arachis hypogaea]
MSLDEYVVLLESLTVTNLGRRFIRCPLFEDHREKNVNMAMKVEKKIKAIASESSRSSRRRGSAQKKGILCGHGERPVLRVFGTKENPGRRFWGCVYYEVNDESEIFRWTDPEAGSEDLHVARLKRKVVDLKADVKTSEWKLKVAAVLGMVGWVACVCCWLQVLLNHNQGVPCFVPLKLG